MANKIPLASVYSYLKQMLSEKWGYIFGTAGIMWTAEKQKTIESRMADNPNYEMSVQYGQKWIGHTVTDCSGVMVYIWKQFGLKIPHGVNSIINQKYITSLSGTPKPGYAAIKSRDAGGNYSHIGIVGEDGRTVYEAKGTVAGFVTSDVSTWKFFGPFKDIDYEVRPVGTPFYGVVTGSRVRLRSGPGTEYGIITHLDSGDIFKVEKLFDSWYFGTVMKSGVQGYISSQYVMQTDYKPGEPDVPDHTDTVSLTLPKDTAQTLYEALKAVLAK